MERQKTSRLYPDTRKLQKNEGNGEKIKTIQIKDQGFIYMYYIRPLIFYYMTGTVKFFNGSKGFGFITNDETGEDIFVHVTSLDGINLNEGDKVSYNEGEGRKGKMATDIELLD